MEKNLLSERTLTIQAKNIEEAERIAREKFFPEIINEFKDKDIKIEIRSIKQKIEDEGTLIEKLRKK